MSLQLIEAYIPHKHFRSVDEKLRSFQHVSYWVSSENKERTLVRILVETAEVEEILNYLESVSNVIEGFETLLIPVQTYMSRETINGEKKENNKDKEEERTKLLRSSRQELINNMEKNSHITLNYTLLILLSAVVATMGFIKDSEAVVIGAMVIAPMIGPVISTAFSSVLGDYMLLLKSSLTALFGIAIVIAISILFNFIFDIGDDNAQFIARTKVELSDFFLAIAAGAAGSLATLRKSSNLVGVMVAVALLPPTVALGLAVAKGMWLEAYGSFLLVTVNVNSILLSAVLVFSLSGIRPVRWQEVKKANVSRPLSIVFILLMLALLLFIIFFGQEIKFE